MDVYVGNPPLNTQIHTGESSESIRAGEHMRMRESGTPGEIVESPQPSPESLSQVYMSSMGRFGVPSF